MVDSNQELLQTEAGTKKKKASPGKSTGGGKADAGAVKSLVRKDNTTVKGQSTAKSAAAPKGETLTKLKRFLKGAWSELKKVHWPNRREIITFTIVVLAAVLIVAVMIFVVDSILSKLLEFIIPK
ncbi:MAG TPA: preprotein translocase subunit SecE [Desulfobacteria bacterium]|nr:preprotein translocase subunit SecE [Desulfobacteria bacterium]